jgi:hypothetical protein
MSGGAIPADMAAILTDGRRRLYGQVVASAAALVILACAFAYGDAFDLHRYAEALPTVLQLASDAMSPDFSRWTAWGGGRWRRPWR